MIQPEGTLLIGIPEIAQVAGVSRSAVSNWRKRYEDFPEPRIQTDSGALFALVDVEEWLLARAKLDRPISPSALLWTIADAARGEMSASQFSSFLTSLLVYIKLSDPDLSTPYAGLVAGGPVLNIPAEARWSEVSALDDSRLLAGIEHAARSMENAIPRVVGLLSGLIDDPKPDPAKTRALIESIRMTAQEGTSLYELFESGLERVYEIDRFSQEHATPDDLSYLMCELGGPSADVVVDPACGTGGLLLMWATMFAGRRPTVTLLGVEKNARVAAQARARFVLYGFEAEIRMADAFKIAPQEWPSADLVLLDPPYGLTQWANPDLLRSDRWTFGVPPARSADMAWLQLALGMLKPKGRAVVVLPASTLRKGGVDQEIRAAMLEAGLIEAAIELPDRIRLDTSVPLALWVLRSRDDAEPSQPVVLIDATELGRVGRSRRQIPEQETEWIVGILGKWRREGRIEAEDEFPAVAMSPDDLHDADLSMNRYKLTTDVDVGSLRSQAADLRARLEVDSVAAAAAVRDLLGDMRGDES